jgi:hypothetical protein
MAVSRWSVAVVSVFAGLVLMSASIGEASSVKPISRYFEVQMHASGTLRSDPDCNVNAPCTGDYLTVHYMNWGWIAYALVVYTEQGATRELHLIGLVPRVGGYFTEQVSYSQSNDCVANFSTGGGEAFNRYLASGLKFDFGGNLLSVDTGPPMDRHFSKCGPGTVSHHGANDTLAAWDGLKGPWHYVGVRAPTRRQLLSGRLFVLLAYNARLGVKHSTGGWLHTSCCGSSLVFVFTPFQGGQQAVFNEERRFTRIHPANSSGFKKY